MGIRKEISLLISSIFLAANVHAGSDNTVGKVTALRYAEDGVYVQFENTPTACNGGSQYRMHGVLQTTHANYNTLVSGLISAHATQKKVEWLFYLDSSVPATCNTSLLVITALEVSQ